MSDTPETPRRTVRRRNKPKKYGDFLETSPVKRYVQEDSSSEELNNDFEELSLQKPTALFSNDDVEGQDMFKFKSRHTKHDLQNKVRDLQNNSPRIESPLKTPRKNMHLDSIKKTTEATPKNVKDIIKKRIVKQVDSDSDEDDFSGSSSDFVPDESEDEASSASSSMASEEEEDKDPPVETKPVSKVQGRGRGKARPKDSEYIVTPDNYFMMNSSKKIATSDHTLARLKKLNLDDNMEQDTNYISEEHKSKIIDLNQSYEQLFDKWMYILSEDFNIILYGIGSKRSVLHQFQKEKLSEYPCIIVNGFFPSLTIKNIMEIIVMDLLKCSHVPSNVGDAVKFIDTRLSDEDMELFLIIHNIDGTMLRNAKAQTTLASLSQIKNVHTIATIDHINAPLSLTTMLRNAKAQTTLASLSQIKNVHTIATIDHINAPLLWDHSKLSKFRFTWWDVTTFLPYSEETSYENSLMTHRSGALQLSSLKSVHQSLTTNAKGIFNIIIQYQLDHQKQSHYQGLPFKELYSKSREQFLVSSDIALRAQLTEFLDHKLVKMKRTYDGSENLVIPIENTLLQQFLEENS